MSVSDLVVAAVMAFAATQGRKTDSRSRPRAAVGTVIARRHLAGIARADGADVGIRDSHLHRGAGEARAFVDAVSDALLDDEQVLDVQLELADDPGSRQAEVDLKIAIPAGAGVREVVFDLGDLDVAAAATSRPCGRPRPARRRDGPPPLIRAPGPAPSTHRPCGPAPSRQCVVLPSSGRRWRPAGRRSGARQRIGRWARCMRPACLPSPAAVPETRRRPRPLWRAVARPRPARKGRAACRRVPGCRGASPCRLIESMARTVSSLVAFGTNVGATGWRPGATSSR